MCGWYKWLLPAFVLLGGTVFCFHRPSRPAAHVRITRQTIEQGKHVVFFLVDGITNRWLAVGHVAKLVGDQVQDMKVKNADGDSVNAPDFWAPSQQSDPPYGYGGADKRELGVTAPTNVAIWRLRVEVEIEERYSFRKYLDIVKSGASALKDGRSVLGAVHDYWYNDIPFHGVMVESEPITNMAAFQMPGQ
jgi:hypothetical protein